MPALLYQTLGFWLGNNKQLEPHVILPKESSAEMASSEIPTSAVVPTEFDLLSLIPSLDVEQSLAMLNGNMAMLITLLTDLRNSYHALIPQIRQHANNQAYGEAMSLAHTAKGLFGYFGMKEVSAVFAACEKSLKAKEWQEDLLSPQFESEYALIMDKIKALTI
jgi:HPt (histidine-containing phosphotransfer) domain-containing protein